MKKQLIILYSLCAFSFYAEAQEISEIQTINGKWYIELFNPKGVRFKTLSILNQRTNTVVKTKQTVSDRLQSSKAITVITNDSLTNSVFELNDKDSLYCVLDDTLVQKELGMEYRLPVTVDKLIDCAPLQNESIVRIDSTGYDCQSSYKGRAIPSLGKVNNWQDAFVIREGYLKMFDYDEYKIGSNSFLLKNAWVKNKNCNDTIITDSSGYFSFVMLPYGCSKYIGQDTLVSADGRPYPMWIRTLSESDFLNLYPGYYKENLLFYIMSTPEIKDKIILNCSPNPAKENITISYSLPGELQFQDCSLQMSTLMGQTLQTQALPSAQGTQILTVGNLPAGVYFCSLLCKGEVFKTVRVVVE